MNPAVLYLVIGGVIFLTWLVGSVITLMRH